MHLQMAWRRKEKRKKKRDDSFHYDNHPSIHLPMHLSNGQKKRRKGWPLSIMTIIHPSIHPSTYASLKYIYIYMWYQGIVINNFLIFQIKLFIYFYHTFMCCLVKVQTCVGLGYWVLTRLSTQLLITYPSVIDFKNIPIRLIPTWYWCFKTLITYLDELDYHPSRLSIFKKWYKKRGKSFIIYIYR